MGDQASNLRRMVENQRQYIIGQLINVGIYKLADGRDLYEATLTELVSEMQWIKDRQARRVGVK